MHSKLASGVGGDRRGKAMIGYSEEEPRGRTETISRTIAAQKARRGSQAAKGRKAAAIFLRLRRITISMLDFGRVHDRARFAILSIRAGVCRAAHIDLDFVIDGAVEISRADVGVKQGLIVIEFFRAGRILGQAWPGRPGRGLGNRRGYGHHSRRLSAATKTKCGKEKPTER